jgi:hypothetical protein
MKKIILVVGFLCFVGIGFSQKVGTPKKIDLSNRSSDHLMIQFSADNWKGAPDSVSSRIKNGSRGANVYFMLDKPFKSNPHFSVAFGLGIGNSNIFLNKLKADINETSSTLKFTSLDTSNRFKRYKISTSYLEVPVELRFSLHPNDPNKSFKVAIGAKVGTLLNAHTKGKTLLNTSGKTINSYTEKISSKSYFNNRRLAVTARVGYGNLSLFGSYNISSSIFKDQVSADTKLLQIGLTISGL